MQEAFLHFIWQYQYYNKEKLTTCSGEEINIIAPGLHNNDAGPDFRGVRRGASIGGAPDVPASYSRKSVRCRESRSVAHPAVDRMNATRRRVAGTRLLDGAVPERIGSFANMRFLSQGEHEGVPIEAGSPAWWRRG